MDRHRTIQPQALRAHLGTHGPAGVSWALPLAYCSGWLGRDRSQHSQLANASRLKYLTCLRVGECNRKRSIPMRLRNHFTTNTDGGSEALPRSTRRSFLRYLGVGAASTALVSGAQALSPVAALAATHKGATSIAQFSPKGSPSGVNVVLVHAASPAPSTYSSAIPLLL